jgi:hypothetical protein
MICILHRILLCDKIKEMFREFGTYEEEEKFVHGFGGET